LGSKVNLIVILTVCDPFTMKSWSEEFQMKGLEINDQIAPIVFLCDPNAELVQHFQLSDDRRESGLGINSKRFSAIIHDGKIVKLNVEKNYDDFLVSGPNRIIDQIQNLKD
jgi:peroxiredoxin